MSRSQELLSELQTVFAQRVKHRQCFDSDQRTHFEIEDPPGTAPPHIIRGFTPLTRYALHIQNPQAKVIYFLAIDNCFFVDGDSFRNKRIDCVVFDDVRFCMAELKLSMTSTSEITILERFDEAVNEKFPAFIQFFNDEFVASPQAHSHERYKFEAWLVYPSHVLTAIKPSFSAARVNEAVRFSQSNQIAGRRVALVWQGPFAF